MPAQPFTVHVDPDVLARQDLAAALPVPATGARDGGRPARAAGSADQRHGAREAARQQSGRARSGRASGAGGARAYAFRRS